jgi:ADP-dependent NAD(P)H-hydrate dehydratase / NAD(P)H-hydrate epimerase
MAAADRATIAAGTPAEVLMQRAGDAVARAALEVAGGRYGRRAVVVCGKGNNGGDGFAAARRLAREGVAVACLGVGDAGAAEGPARRHLERLRAAGIALEPFAAERLEGADVVIDAIFGTGFRGRVEGDAADAIAAINACGAPVVAADIPSGVDGSTGAVVALAARASVTVALGAEKHGTAVGAGSVHAGRVTVADIGIALPRSSAAVTEDADVSSVLPRRHPEAHKTSGGAVAVLGGSAGMTGAALLCCRGAFRMGAGYVTLGTTPATEAAKAIALPEVVSVAVADDVLEPGSLDRFGKVLGRAGALALGPGLGRGDRQRELVERALAEVGVPIVLDADGLNVLEGGTEPLERRSAPTIITPHPAELARLLGSEVSDIEADRLAAARGAARRFSCVVVLKGWRTVVSEPSGETVVNPTGGPELATAGTGDVLTGAVAALAAAGVEPLPAAWAAVYVHGRAGTLAGRGAVAWDVAEALPQAVAAVKGPRTRPQGGQ